MFCSLFRQLVTVYLALNMGLLQLTANGNRSPFLRGGTVHKNRQKHPKTTDEENPKDCSLEAANGPLEVPTNVGKWADASDDEAF